MFLIVPFGEPLTFSDGYFFVYPHRMRNNVNAQSFGFWLQRQCANQVAGKHRS